MRLARKDLYKSSLRKAGHAWKTILEKGLSGKVALSSDATERGVRFRENLGASLKNKMLIIFLYMSLATIFDQDGLISFF